jgi:hypothetical protein
MAIHTGPHYRRDDPSGPIKIPKLTRPHSATLKLQPDLQCSKQHRDRPTLLPPTNLQYRKVLRYPFHLPSRIPESCLVGQDCRAHRNRWNLRKRRSILVAGQHQRQVCAQSWRLRYDNVFCSNKEVETRLLNLQYAARIWMNEISRLRETLKEHKAGIKKLCRPTRIIIY